MLIMLASMAWLLYWSAAEQHGEHSKDYPVFKVPHVPPALLEDLGCLLQLHCLDLGFRVETPLMVIEEYKWGT